MLIQNTIFAQLSEDLKNLEGRWYQDSRKVLNYSIWQDLGNQTLENQCFSILCGDTLMLSRAMLEFTTETARLSMQSEGKPLQHYRLVKHDNDQLIWENEQPKELPKNLEWRFSNGGYATFSADGEASDYRKEVKPQFSLKFRAFVGANMNQYANPVNTNRFLGRINVALAQGETQMMPGKEAGISLGLQFPSKLMCLNFELGFTQRQVGILGRFNDQKNGIIADRDGHYQTSSLYFGVVPEVFVGRKGNFSISSGFYADIYQQRHFQGQFNTTDANAHSNFYGKPERDLNMERGFILGLNYRIRRFDHFQPQVYLRYTYDLSNTRLRALSLGTAVDFEMR
jgi:hypothetical protein